MAAKSCFALAARVAVSLAVVAQPALPSGAWAADAAAAPVAAAADAPSDWATREALSGDWGGARSALKERGVVVKPRLTQFVQGLSAGDGEHGYEYGAKADLFVAADLGKLGFWNGFSMTLQADVNFGRNVNGRGGVLIPVNAALNAPGMEGSDAFDLSSAYFRQDFGDGVSLVLGKVNMIELVSAKPFMGGAGIDSFWNQSFVATPTGTVPPYLFGALMSVFTEPATYRLWLYDPNSAVNKNITDAFDGGVSVRGSVDFNVRLGGLRGHQGFTAFYGTQKGADLQSLDDVFLPTPDPGAITYKDKRWYVAYSFDQYAYQPAERPGEGFGLVRQHRRLGRQPQRVALVDALRHRRPRPDRGPQPRQLGHRLLLRRPGPDPEGRPRARGHAARRAGPGALLQLRAHSLVRDRRRSADHPARPGQQHRRRAGPARRDPLLKPMTT